MHTLTHKIWRLLTGAPSHDTALRIDADPHALAADQALLHLHLDGARPPGGPDPGAGLVVGRMEDPAWVERLLRHVAHRRLPVGCWRIAGLPGAGHMGTERQAEMLARWWHAAQPVPMILDTGGLGRRRRARLVAALQRRGVILEEAELSICSDRR